jgi:hypothetical protein
MRNLIVTTALLFLFSKSSIAQDSIPLLTGKVNISITKGTVDCELTLSNIPRIKDYFIRLNSGMNIRYFRNPENNYKIYFDKSFFDTLSSGESNAYFFPSNGGKDKFLPNAIEFKYVGMYPVISDSTKDYSVEDWKGNVAFNGYSLRVDGSQSAWYPVLFDIKKEQRYDKVKYNIEINCPDCNSLYVNGSLPVTGSTGHFKSDVPQQLTLYCGNYKTSNVNGTYILNPDISEEQIKQFGNFTNDFKKYYSDKLGIPYKQAITYVHTTPTSKDNAWLFVSYPTIVIIGRDQYGLKGLFDEKKANWFRLYIAHELGHYYFGSYKVFNSPLGDMMSEGFSEYLSWQVGKHLMNDSTYIKMVKQKIKALNNFTATPFGNITSQSDYKNRELYVYYYAPLIFSAIEKEVGEQVMWKWLKAILETKADFTNYAFLEQTLSSVLPEKNKMETLKSKYFYSDQSLENAIKTVGLD